MIYSVKKTEEDKILINDTVLASVTEEGYLQMDCDVDVMTMNELEELGNELLNIIEVYVNKGKSLSSN